MSTRSEFPALDGLPDESTGGGRSSVNGALRKAAPRVPSLYVAVFGGWALVLLWFTPRLLHLLEAARGPWSYAGLIYFIAFTQIAWLYGLFNVGVIVFARLYRRRENGARPRTTDPQVLRHPRIAVLYTTCNDFVESSALSCVGLDYPHFTVYILDDSSDPGFRDRIDAFASRFTDRVRVVRRAGRHGYKAGNLNHALRRMAREPLFVIADADEILPRDFLSRLVPRLIADPLCGFVQANHMANPEARSPLARALGLGIDIHWRWYQPLRNRYGFVMFLGHGALLRRSCWEEIGGFPELVSEDLAYALAIRERGYYGTFAEDVVCFEDFPETVRAFRIRHVKWTRGTCEFLAGRLGPLLRSRRISWTEKLDVLFPTLNLPLSLGYLLFMLDASVLLPYVLGEFRPLTVELAGREWVFTGWSFSDHWAEIFTLDFYLITVLTVLAPVLAFIVELHRRPARLLRFLTHSTALYAALSPLSAFCVVAYLVTGRARFLVTGDESRTEDARGETAREPHSGRLWRFLSETHPDHAGLWGFEVAVGLVFLAVSLVTAQVSFVGLSIAFLLLPYMHFAGWAGGVARVVVWMPFSLVAIGLALGGAGILGLQPALFGFGFHF